MNPEFIEEPAVVLNRTPPFLAISVLFKLAAAIFHQSTRGPLYAAGRVGMHGRGGIIVAA